MPRMNERMGEACCLPESVEACMPVVRKVNVSSGEDAFAAHDSVYGVEHAVESAWNWHDYEAAKHEEYSHGL
jgi:hypothetical protein